MVTKLLTRIFGSRNDRMIGRLRKTAQQINALEPSFQALSDEALQAKTLEFKERYQKGESLDKLLPEAFAAVREASRRVHGMRHFDTQLIGGMVLHMGKIAEMRTGEGKTLVATLPAYLNALTGEGVHVVTVNDYLAKRDANWMRPVYGFLGLTVGINIPDMDPAEKKAAYQADITYGTNNEFGFDYLRDNMAFRLEDRAQRKLHFAIVDEVDSILIDEARTPLIISGAAEDSSQLYAAVDLLVRQLKRQHKEEKPDGSVVISDDERGDFYVDEKTRQVYLTENGQEQMEELLAQTGLLPEGQSLYSASSISLLHHINAALRAIHCYQRDVDYIVRDNQVIIVDEHTGRTMVGRRWSEGLHQAMEAKEHVEIRQENQTLASITFQNYFRLYQKLSGMTGTADTEAFEFQQIYSLEVLIVPTNRPMVRKDMADLVFLNRESKYKAIIEDIRQARAAGRPSLVGTIAIETSEYLSQELTKAGIPHQVLNAKFHAQEAEIVAQAGKPGAVTIATNMAGRGTDILLGGNWKVDAAKLDNPTPEQLAQLEADWKRTHDAVLEAGGLHIIGTERHESRRIDNQLRGRAGRQGDKGSSRFYLGLDDNLMRLFGSERIAAMMQKLGMAADEAIEHPWVSKAIENAQRKVEARNFDIRKQLLEYDDVANDQRKVIYEQRDELMASDDISETIGRIAEDVFQSVISQYIPPQSLHDLWDVPGLEQRLSTDFGLELPINDWLEQDERLHEEPLRVKIFDAYRAAYQQKEQQVGTPVLRHFEKAVMMQTLDSLWKEHLAAMDHLRQGIHLRGYAQKNPKQEYKREAFELFTGMLDNLKQETISVLARVRVQSEQEVAEMEQQQREQQARQAMQFQHPGADSLNETGEVAEAQAAPVSIGVRVGRNDPCPCGSGKKYKHCHGQLV